MKDWGSVIFLVMIFWCGIFFAAGLDFVIAPLMRDRDHLPDEILIQNLNTDIKKFELLIKMFKEDTPVSVVHPTWIAPENAITKERWYEYKKLFSELRLDGGMRSWLGESILFTSTAQGLSIGGSSKGYIYKPESPVPLYTNLENISPYSEKSGKGYKKINENWYIYFDWSY